MTKEEFEAKYVNKIICGDCLEVMTGFPDGCMDIVFCDPPYNLGKKYGINWDDDLRPREYWAWFEKLMAGLSRVCVTGYLYLFHSDKGVYNAKPIIEAAGFRYVQTLIWWGKNGYSHQLHRRTWSYRHEPFIFSVKGEPETLSVGAEDVDFTSVFDVPRPQSNYREGRYHPTEKPIELYRRLLARTPGRLVFDPTCGAGSACIASCQKERCFVGIDNSEEYCLKARDRISAMRNGLSYSEA